MFSSIVSTQLEVIYNFTKESQIHSFKIRETIYLMSLSHKTRIRMLPDSNTRPSRYLLIQLRRSTIGIRNTLIYKT